MFPSNFPHTPPVRGSFLHPAPNPDAAICRVHRPFTDFIHHQTPPDGDCLFRCVYMGLSQPGVQAPSSEVMALRYRVVDYVSTNAQALAGIECFEGLAGIRLLHDLLCTPRAWNTGVGDLVVPLLAQVLGREIIILQSHGDNAAYTLQLTFRPNNPNLPPVGSNTGGLSIYEPPIYLAHVAGGTHYVYLEPRNTLLNTQQANRPSLTREDQASIDTTRFQSSFGIRTPKINERQLESQLQDWVNTGSIDEKNARTSAKDSILSAFKKKTKSLCLSNRPISSLPSAIGYLTKLEVLEFQHTELDSLPDTIGELKNLRAFDCSHSPITSLPDTIGNLTNLQRLNCSNTPITSFPNIRNLAQLAILELTNCHLPSINLRALPANNRLRVYLENNRLSAHIVNSLIQAQAAANYNGPSVILDIYEGPITSPDLTARNIDKPLKDLGYPNTKDLAALRKAIKPCDDMGNVANDFTQLLAKINDHAPKEGGQLVGSIKTHIDNVLQTLDQLYSGRNDSARPNKEQTYIRETIAGILAEAAEANRSCVDRSLVCLLKMSAQCSLHNASSPELAEAISQDIQRISSTIGFINGLNSGGLNKLVYDIQDHRFVSPFGSHSGVTREINIQDAIEDILVLLNSGLLRTIKGIDMNYEACATLRSIDRANANANNRINSLVDAAKIYILEHSSLFK